MKKIIVAVTTALITFSQVNVAEARYQNSNRYSSEYEFSDPITELLEGADWTKTFNKKYMNPNKRTSLRYNNYTYNSIVEYGYSLQRQGFRVSEHPYFGGVHRHSKHSAHYSGNAIDVNVVAGNDYGVPYARHKLDQLASEARAAGYKVLWKVPGHYNHLHLQR